MTILEHALLIATGDFPSPQATSSDGAANTSRLALTSHAAPQALATPR
jgi:hypothetical protein